MLHLPFFERNNLPQLFVVIVNYHASILSAHLMFFGGNDWIKSLQKGATSNGHTSLISNKSHALAGSNAT